MVAAKVRDGGGTLSSYFTEHGLISCQDEPSDTFLKCQEEVQAISCTSLFTPVVRQEAVQAMGQYFCRRSDMNLTELQIVLVSGWSDNGWLSGGHAVRMAMEICE